MRPLSLLFAGSLLWVALLAMPASLPAQPPGRPVDDVFNPDSSTERLSGPVDHWLVAQTETELWRRDGVELGPDGPPGENASGNSEAAKPESEKDKRKWPDIKQPGPDLGDFPNSAYTLPKGRSYLEFAPVTFSGPDRQSPASYVTPFLLRYGVTDDLEFRVFGSGLTHIFGRNEETGLSPLSLDLKAHLWDDKKEWFIPASSLEVYLQTTWGSQQFDGGWQSSVNLNFDLPVTEKLNFEWTIGYTGVQDAVNVVTGEAFVPRHNHLNSEMHRANLNTYQLSVQWAVEYELTEEVQLFYHGFYNGAVLFQQGSGIVTGVGLFWQLNERWTTFGSVNAGLSADLPPLLVQWGFAVAI